MIVTVQFAPCDDAVIDGRKAAGQCGECTRCGKSVKVAHDPLVRGRTKQQKEARSKALGLLTAACELKHPGGVPLHVDRVIPPGVRLWLQSGERLIECGWTGAEVTGPGGVVAPAAPLLVAFDTPACAPAGLMFLTELVKKRYWRARVCPPELLRLARIQATWDELLD